MGVLYVIEFNFKPNARGGRWGAGWSEHTSLPGLAASAAKRRFRALRANYPDVQQHWRLVKHRQSGPVVVPV